MPLLVDIDLGLISLAKAAYDPFGHCSVAIAGGSGGSIDLRVPLLQTLLSTNLTCHGQ